MYKLERPFLSGAWDEKQGVCAKRKNVAREYPLIVSTVFLLLIADIQQHIIRVIPNSQVLQPGIAYYVALFLLTDRVVCCIAWSMSQPSTTTWSRLIMTLFNTVRLVVTNIFGLLSRGQPRIAQVTGGDQFKGGGNNSVNKHVTIIVK